MIIVSLLILLSLVILYFGANWLVQGGASLAARLGVSPLIIGLTIVSFGTSAPELVVSVGSALAGQSALSIGNVLGSSTFNIGVILGVSAIIYPLLVKKQLFKLDVPVMLGSTVLFLVTFIDGKITFWEALTYLIVFVIYMTYIIFTSLKSKKKDDDEESFQKTKHWLIDVALIGVGLAGLIFGSDLLVKNSVILAKHWGMSEALIGLTIVAIGTSMPELATSVVAALKKQSDIAIGNVVGSNIFNILLILGAAGVISPIQTKDINLLDSVYLLLLSVVLFFFMRMRRNINRVEGTVLFLMYIGYFLYKLLM
ncbi:MAG: calcium/sodium antiporter [Petrimonas sp.]|nr:calcium/sodium antiporter [Petrimonas sp.]